MRVALIFALAFTAFAFLSQTRLPTCGAQSPHGPRIGGVILIEGCP
jgi:hypothetical protein